MPVYLDTERLTLRQFTADDADRLIELDSDPEVMRFLTGGEPTAPADVRDGMLPRIIERYQQWGGKFGIFAAEAKAGGAFLGWFLLRPEPDGPLDEAELGYRLRRAEWGKGYATEGSRAVLGKAFTELGVRRVWADTMALNDRSQNVMKKLGMTLECTLETPEDMLMVEGSELGGVRYQITREQWGRLSRDPGIGR